MSATTPDEIGDFRQEVRDFLKENLPDDMAHRGRNGFLAAREDSLGWQQILAKKGWSVPHWPEEHGGPGWSAMQRYVFDEECYLAGAPTINIGGVGLVAPVIQAFGTQEQKDRFLPPIRNGEVFWIQGFSEPSAGSDLASLRTTAVRQGDEYVINGQKIWTSHGLFGDWNFMLARTDPEAKKQAGISFFLIDVKTPGLTIRPIESLEGSHHLTEVFYDDVRVPVSNRVGEENKGWDYTKYLLFNERAFYGAEAPSLKRYLAKIKTYARRETVDGRPLIENCTFATRLAELELEVMAVDMTVSRVIAHGLTERNGGNAVGSILKVRGTELAQKLTDLLVETIGDYGAYAYPDTNEEPEMRDMPHAGPNYAPGLFAELIYRRAASIYGGANEVQRNIIAKTLFRF
ncbi:acyl-CoA dehydrogenase family protein [Tropicimonas isoalkanivorans]|uniref:Acyl-CoA dehydrogenase n=1 Tax=Tropicimonas isoalkanivorans TaxID=441112 RepID=A0A1I1I693_9RHOB|nr:acyl-CoA dehydrogenase family protein [Tropicimonas isoalkanivorans]SFC29203.1 acyl-CoA dehydrogenase [Tropicimonas isoalkanivorans]